ncbi:Atrial natriuretic peptide receptor 1, partial [Blattella germanica]
HTTEIVAGVIGGLALILAIVLLVVYRNWRYEQELDSLLWKVDYKDIQMDEEHNNSTSLSNKISRAIHPLIRTSQVSLSSNPDSDFRYSTIYTQIGIYKGRIYAIKKVRKKSVDITREMKKELKIVSYLNKNFNKRMIGMIYLHESPVRVHGNLKMSNCLVDSRWVVKIADFGLYEFKQEDYHMISPCEGRKSKNSFNFVRDCVVECWAENPEDRPDFKTVRTKLRPLRKGMKPNIFDNMMAMMEKYANNLEALVDERTDQLVEEKKKTEALLYEMLPRSVAEQLKRGNKVEAESFDCVTIYFSDIVGFTSMSAESTPLQVVDFLNDLYTCFDSTIENYDVYKVETIGDAYMVVSGLPIRNGEQHAGEIATMSLHLLEAIKRFRIRHRPVDNLMLRIGIHSGPVCAGVVGLKMPRYCLFGDTVNTASRMESTGSPLRIHCSSECKAILERLGGYTLAERGLVRMKGKGDQHTYWLVGEDSARRAQRTEERAARRHKPKVNGYPCRSSLKCKPPQRCPSLESPKRLRFAVQRDPLLEAIADASPCKKPQHPRLLEACSSSCPCIEQCPAVASLNCKISSVPALFPSSAPASPCMHQDEPPFLCDEINKPLLDPTNHETPV